MKALLPLGLTAAGISTGNPMLIASGVGSGLGAIKGHQDEVNYNREKEAQAQIQQWSPWTGLQGKLPTAVNPMDSTLQGGLTGAMFSQQLGGKAPTAPGSSPSNSAGLNFSVLDPGQGKSMMSGLSGNQSYMGGGFSPYAGLGNVPTLNQVSPGDYAFNFRR